MPLELKQAATSLQTSLLSSTTSEWRRHLWHGQCHDNTWIRDHQDHALRRSHLDTFAAAFSETGPGDMWTFTPQHSPLLIHQAHLQYLYLLTLSVGITRQPTMPLPLRRMWFPIAPAPVTLRRQPPVVKRISSAMDIPSLTPGPLRGTHELPHAPTTSAPRRTLPRPGLSVPSLQLPPIPPQHGQTPVRMDIVVFFDGAARLDPACGGSGALVMPRDYPLLCDYDVHFILTATTNNQAEYDHLLRSLQLAQSRGYTHLTVYGDSQLLMRQMQGIYRVSHPGLGAQYLQSRPAA
ncbi:hypothetical protein DYB28_010533 [Aphanomyces astaci]|uniref:RNase H type-1 domain-containing protein n=1 Tax=Aphanomyces astaci TaxID=112090 RepID=A0A9X8H9F2_APHAT|nr:hypothetical protein DYB28_010533 [Aphanomyces astaci]